MTGGDPVDDRTLGTRVFTLDDQRAFAALSGDYNPMHVDPVRARRLLFGGVVVHGVHSALWALDRFLAERAEAVRLTSVRFEFPAPLTPGVAVEAVEAEGPGLEGVRLEVRSAEGVAARVHAGLAPAGPQAGVPAPDGSWRREPRDRTAEELAGEIGELDLAVDPDLLGDLLPGLARWLDRRQAALLLASTRLVGMEAPGLHSLFTRLSLTFGAPDAGSVPDVGSAPVGGPAEGGAADADEPPWWRLAYRVVTAHARTGLVRMALETAGARGEIQALVRPRPVGQISAGEAAGRVAPGEFAGVDVLIVGGSRGLGEVAAKLLAAGGAAVTCTYARGHEDAERVVADIREAGGDARAAPLDVLDPSAPVPPAEWLLYFASPRIRTGEAFDQAEFDHYCRYYVEGFLRVAGRSGATRVLYPSTVFIEDAPPGFATYVEAKRAGEAACETLRHDDPSVRIRAPRLPRMRTDQTVGVVRIAAEDPVDPLLAELRALAADTP